MGIALFIVAFLLLSDLMKWMPTGGIVGVLIADYIIKSLPLTVLKWVVLCVLVYTAVTMLKSAFKSKAKDAQVS